EGPAGSDRGGTRRRLRHPAGSAAARVRFVRAGRRVAGTSPRRPGHRSDTGAHSGRAARRPRRGAQRRSGQRQGGPCPSAEPAAEPVPLPAATKSPSALPRHRILVVDDNVDAAVSLAMLLRLMGQETEVVHDGPSALKTAPAFRPEIVLLDIGMPGMDGHEVARQLRRQADMDKACLVALTAYGQDKERELALEPGCNQHFTKPINPEALEQLLADAQPQDG